MHDGHALIPTYLPTRIYVGHHHPVVLSCDGVPVRKGEGVRIQPSGAHPLLYHRGVYLPDSTRFHVRQYLRGRGS